ncbi:MAG TPA: hypothetical protein VF648_05995 [Pyrinomonadaceae bacterium]|jgi:hypothetical protein
MRRQDILLTILDLQIRTKFENIELRISFFDPIKQVFFDSGEAIQLIVIVYSPLAKEDI